MKIKATIFCFVIAVADFLCSAVDVKNSVVGAPEVECMEEKLKLNVATDQPFTGNIFVKGKYSDEACVQKYRDNKHKGAYFVVQLGRCGMQRLRSASPRGMNFVITVVVNFHPLFVTHVDRAFNIRCFYMETDEQISSKLEVSMIPTTNLYDSMSMPKCKYSVRLQSPQGNEVAFAKVGDNVFHVWECSGPDMGIMVKKCFVNDGSGQEVAVLDYNGCSTDTQLLSELTYDSSLMKAWAQSLVFKYADKNTLYFSCQVLLCQKQLGMCDGITPPKCTNSTGFVRSRRSSSVFRGNLQDSRDPRDNSKNTLDVVTDELTVFDLQKQMAHSQAFHFPYDNDTSQIRYKDSADGLKSEWDGRRFCISVPLLSASICLSLSLIIICSAAAVLIYKVRAKKMAEKLSVHFAPVTNKI